jgi:hypothetical protein
MASTATDKLSELRNSEGDDDGTEEFCGEMDGDVIFLPPPPPLPPRGVFLLVGVGGGVSAVMVLVWIR